VWSELTTLVENPEKLTSMKVAALRRAQPNAAEKIAHHLAELLTA
jgi:hypothetical protein